VSQDALGGSAQAIRMRMQAAISPMLAQDDRLVRPRSTELGPAIVAGDGN